jgi:hypothetical protein
LTSNVRGEDFLQRIGRLLGRPNVCLHGHLQLGIRNGADLGFSRRRLQRPGGQVAGVETSTLTVNASGALSGSTSGGCSYTGTVEPHAAGNVYDVSTVFGAGCLFSGQTFKGHAYLSGKVLYAVVPKADLSTGALFVGTKP